MKYWGYLIAKLGAAGFLIFGLWQFAVSTMPPPGTFMHQRVDRFGQDLRWTLIILVLWLLGVGLAYAIVLDQKNRCRICLRRLRMPVEKGSWSGFLLNGWPSTEYICPYGHGTLKVTEPVLGEEPQADWIAHGDIWEELEQAHPRDRRH